MADAPKILGTDSLRQAYPKLNNAIDNSNAALTTANTAKSTADGAVTTANDANKKADNTQKQLDQVTGASTIDPAVEQMKVDTDGVTHASPDARLRSDYEKVNTQLLKQADYSLFPQAPKPEKKGIKTASPKLIHKIDNDTLRIVQKTNKGYIRYIFQKNNGASQAGRDYGTNHELIRMVDAKQIEDAYVYKEMGTPKTGTLSIQYAAGNLNSIETLLSPLKKYDAANNFSSKGTDGMAVYSLASGNSVEYDIKVNNEKKGNVIFLCSAGGSDNVDILVNNIVVKNFNPRTYVVGANQSVGLIEFEVPITANSSSTYTLKISNKGTGNAYPCAINYSKLIHFSGQDVDQYKCFGSNREGWIVDDGASDYAIYDDDTGLWFGSYHGGEISLYDRILWSQSYINQRDDYDLSHTPFANIVTGDWRIQKDFEIYQRTSLANGKAEMVSKFDFNTDGTLEMDFNYSSGTANVSVFYTALTCTHSSFDYIYQPIFKSLGSTPSGNFIPLPLSEGKVSQGDSTNLLQLDIRFTKFNNQHDSRGAGINDVSYRKLYYGPVYGSGPVLIDNINFSKALDFIVR